VILMYHKVDLRPRTMWWVSVDAFHRQMNALAGYRVVALDDYDPADPRQIVITFDGPYEDVVTYAAPVLAEFGYPFELFVVGDWMGRVNDFDAAEPAARFASLEQLEQLTKFGGRIQWHTRTHARLSADNESRWDHELDVDDRLRARFAPPHLQWFSYPHGDFAAGVADRVRSRFAGAVACDADADDTVYRLRRVTVTESWMPDRPTVALIVANYNYGRFIGAALESVLGQTDPPDDLVVVDDASTDESLEVLAPYRDRVRLLVNEHNLGIVENFRRAVAATRTDYIAFLGADNRLRCDFVERCRAALDRHPGAAVAYTDVMLFGPRARWQALRCEANPEFKVHEHFADPATGERLYLWRFPEPVSAGKSAGVHGNFIHGSSMYRRAAYEAVGGYRQTNQAEDKDLFARMLKAGWDAVRVPHPLLEYRQHSIDQSNVSLGLEQALAAQIQANLALRRRVDELELELAAARRSAAVTAPPC
jgi:GT2 family glycosyltransferase/peptidoglycan/xylan/chitin deacetylase (PgdA/CDA1 family)